MSVERFTDLGETLTNVKDTLKVLMGDVDKLGTTDPEKVLALTLVASIWKNCTVLQDHLATRRARMEEDPSKIPEISQEDHGEFRSMFVIAHPDVLLNPRKEPRKKFVERINRDFQVHGCIPFYELGELRVRSETLAPKVLREEHRGAPHY